MFIRILKTATGRQFHAEDHGNDNQALKPFSLQIWAYSKKLRIFYIFEPYVYHILVDRSKKISEKM